MSQSNNPNVLSSYPSLSWEIAARMQAETNSKLEIADEYINLRIRVGDRLLDLLRLKHRPNELDIKCSNDCWIIELAIDTICDLIPANKTERAEMVKILQTIGQSYEKAIDDRSWMEVYDEIRTERMHTMNQRVKLSDADRKDAALFRDMKEKIKTVVQDVIGDVELDDETHVWASPKQPDLKKAAIEIFSELAKGVLIEEQQIKGILGKMAWDALKTDTEG
jgi:hypothetical protein